MRNKTIFFILVLFSTNLSPFNWKGALEDIIGLSPLGSIVYQELKGKDNINEHQEYYYPKYYNTTAEPPTTTNVTFEDVVGLEEVLIEIQETVEFLKNPHRFITMGAELPKGILLEGPPGTGKTLIARAIAGEAGCAFYQANGSEFHKTYVGEGPQAIRSLFEKARDNAPSVVFIDEIDAVGSKRSDDGSAAGNEFNAMVGELLAQMDGFKKDSGIVVIGATNLAKNLDTALLRPERFSRQIKIPLPTKNGRCQILEYYLKKLPPGKLDLPINQISGEISQLSGKVSPADLKNIVNEAAIVAVRHDSNVINMDHFILALDRLQLGIKNKLEQTLKQRKRTAYHESGHAIIKILKKEPVSRITIESRGHALGATFGKATSDTETADLTKEKLLDKIMISQAGGAAEEIIFGNKTLGISDDQKRAEEYARILIEFFGTEKFPGVGSIPSSETMKYEIDKEVLSILQNCLQKSKELLMSNKEMLDELANTLLKKETMSEDEIYKTLGMRKPAY
ncbi:AAA family ATPase [Candidatus Babeliales bacterium]|nr:AAA family ATPase [Candidatus Babeliales bacterium]